MPKFKSSLCVCVHMCVCGCVCVCVCMLVNKIVQPNLSSVSPGMQVQQHCWEHSTGFQWRLALSTKLLVSVFNVSIRTVCHLIFLTFFIHTVRLGRRALLTPHCWQFLASLLRPLAKDLSLFLDPLSGTHYHYPSENHSVLQLLKQSLRLIFFAPICSEVQVLVSVCIHSGGVCVCVCVCVCLSVCLYVIIILSGWGYFCVRWYGILVLMLNWLFQHDYLDTVLSVLYACVLYFCICTCSAQFSMFHMERRFYAHYYYYYYYYYCYVCVICMWVHLCEQITFAFMNALSIHYAFEICMVRMTYSVKPLAIIWLTSFCVLSFREAAIERR